MPAMTYKNGFEPKDARTVHSYDQDDELDDFDDWSLESIPPRPRRQRKTGTQALVEFLNTTSPEEFQKTPPTPPTTTNSTMKRRSTRFFLRRLHKNKSSSSSTSSTPSSTSGGSSLASLYQQQQQQQQQQSVPHTIHRKNYIEIVTSHPTRSPHYYDPVTQGTSPFQASKISLNEPILPNRRESSLHAPSIRSLSIHKSSPYTTTTSSSSSTTTTPATATALNSQFSSGITTNTTATSLLTTTSLKSPKMYDNHTSTKKDNDSIRNGTDSDDKNDRKRNMVDALVATCDGMDVIEAGLIQRLKQCQLYEVNKPMDVVTNQLTEEHIRALKVSAAASAAMGDGGGGDDGKKKKGRTRHAQVQTLAPTDLSDKLMTNIPTSSSSSSTTTTTTTTMTMTTNYSIEDLQRQLVQERQERQRLEAALESTCDHFEVLSGLAYKKLRELWEEKLRWENACVELNDKLQSAEQKDGNHHNDNMNDVWTEDYQHSDYIVG